MADIRDVARRAGCSIATVSRAHNAPHLLRPATLERVQAAAAELKFRPSALGRQLRNERSGLIGVMLPTLANPVFADCVRGIEERLDEVDGRLVLITTRYEPEREKRAIETLLRQRVDGLLLTLADAGDSPLLAELREAAVPYVLLYNDTPDEPAVSVNNRRAAFDGVTTLIAAGHRRITMVTGALRSSDRARLRYTGYRDALAAAGCAAQPPVEVDFNMSSLPRSVIADLLAGPTPPSALFCSNDLLALAVMQALREAGQRVPEDMSIMGFDGLAFGQLVSPQLSTVAQPSVDIGRCASHRLLEKIAGRPDQPGVLELQHAVRNGGTVRSLP